MRIDPRSEIDGIRALPELEVLRALKGRSAAISLHSTADEILQRTPVRKLYRLPEL